MWTFLKKHSRKVKKLQRVTNVYVLNQSCDFLCFIFSTVVFAVLLIPQSAKSCKDREVNPVTKVAILAESFDFLHRQGRKFSTKLKTNMKLRTNGRWVGTQTGVGVPTTLVYSFLISAAYAAAGVCRAMYCDQKGFTPV